MADRTAVNVYVNEYVDDSGVLLGVVMVFALLAACGPVSAPSGPPEIDPGLHTCDLCRMAISELEHAAVARHADGTAARFDDPGCLARWLADEPEPGAWQAWLADASGAGWVPVEEAWIVPAPSRLTPMGSGLLAFGDRAAAEGAAREHGAEVVGWEEARGSLADGGAR